MARRAQTLNYINGYAVPGEKSTGLQPVAPVAPAHMVEAEAPPSTLPAWVAYDRKVGDAPHRYPLLASSVVRSLSCFLRKCVACCLTYHRSYARFGPLLLDAPMACGRGGWRVVHPGGGIGASTRAIPRRIRRRPAINRS